MQRKLTAILSADVVGYTGLMEADETGTLERLKLNRNQIFEPKVESHGGRVFKLLGDGALVEFSSVVAAVNCALEIQEATAKTEQTLSESDRIRYRMGINLGDIIIDGDDMYGEGVNVATRLQTLAPVGGVALSRVVRDQVEGKTPCIFEDMGEHTVKNIERPVHVYSALSVGSSAHVTTVAESVKPLLAVLAFDNLSGDPELAYFSDGISEEILMTVARGADLKVIARSSSFQFRGANKAIRQVAAQLKTTHVLDGSVRRSGSRVRISASLIECARQTTLWSDRFDRELSDVFALQDEIATAVAAALKITFAPAQSETVDPSAYNLYLKALALRNKGLEAETQLAVIQMLETATELAPKFARAWVMLATLLAAWFRFSESESSDAALRVRVVAAAEMALKLDPGLGGAYQALSQLEPFGRYEEREALHLKALSVAPSDPTVLTNASLFFTEIGRIREALKYSKHAYDLDPMSPWAANWYGNMLAFAGEKKLSQELFRTLSARWPDNALIAANAILVAACLGDWAWFDELVVVARERHLESATLHRCISTGQAMRSSDPVTRSSFIRQARDALSRSGSLSLGTCMNLCNLGAIDEAFELIGQTSLDHMLDPVQRAERGNVSEGIIFSELHSARMIHDPRFPGLCGKLGLCNYWVKTERWPDCADESALTYDFKAEARRLVSA
jgi:adenylate cyclase